MPLAVAEYLRHLATRCSRMSRDCTDQVITKELVQISVELVEKAEIPAGEPDDVFTEDIVPAGDDDKSKG